VKILVENATDIHVLGSHSSRAAEEPVNGNWFLQVRSVRPSERDKLISWRGQARKIFRRYTRGLKRKFHARTIAHDAHEISRRSCDRARLLWKPARTIAIFRVVAYFSLTMTARDHIFLRDRKNIFDRTEFFKESRWPQ
jgi:hypothetical protein